MYSLHAILLVIVSLTLVSAIPAAAPVLPPAGAVSLVLLDVKLDGNGCRPGQVSVALAGDNSVLTIIFDNFTAADGPKAGTASTRAFCRVNIGINSPGWAFDITSADFRGYVYVEKGVEASLVSRWKWIDETGKDMKGKVNRFDNPLQEFGMLIIIFRETFKRRSLAPLRTISFCTRMANSQITSHPCVKRLMRGFKSVCPLRSLQEHPMPTDMCKVVRRMQALARY